MFFGAKKRVVYDIVQSGAGYDVILTSGGKLKEVSKNLIYELKLKKGDTITFKLGRNGRLKWMKKDKIRVNAS